MADLGKGRAIADAQQSGMYSSRIFLFCQMSTQLYLIKNTLVTC